MFLLCKEGTEETPNKKSRYGNSIAGFFYGVPAPSYKDGTVTGPHSGGVYAAPTAQISPLQYRHPRGGVKTPPYR